MNIIRAADKVHYDLVIQLLGALYLELGEESSSVGFLDHTLLEKIFSGSTVALLALENESPVGLATVTETQAIYAGGRYGVIDEMYVVPAYRSRAVGKMLVDEVKRIGKSKGWKRIDVTTPTDESKTRTVKFYRNQGFVFTGSKLKIVPDKSGYFL